MELSTQESQLEELIMSTPNIDNWNSFPTDQFLIPNTWSFEFTPFDIQTPTDSHFQFTNPNPYSLLEHISPPQSISNHNNHCPFVVHPNFPEFSSFYEIDDADLSAVNYPVVIDDQEYAATKLENTDYHQFGFVDDDAGNCFKTTQVDNIATDNSNIINGDDLGFCGEKKSRLKKANGEPSKNLMAERRRRKRLNDRLSMLRSIVPKISKMDRTSILGDTIDYMKELLEKIEKLREEACVDDENLKEISLIGNYLKELKPKEMLVKNPPKFNVERRDDETRVEVCCTAKPGILISTLSTLDALGLEIQQCVISCFNDFSLQASCYEAAEHRSIVNSEDLKQALFRNAGYGSRCL